MVACKFDSKLDCRVASKHGISPCLTCRRNKGQIALGVFC
jgi:hypothetical protein